MENQAGAIRRSLFVPAPSFSDVRGCSERLLGACPGASRGKGRYRKGKPEPGFLGGDRAALLPLPSAPFACVTWIARKCD